MKEFIGVLRKWIAYSSVILTIGMHWPEINAALMQYSGYSLKITEFFVPKEVLLGSEVQMICKYSLENNTLYSFKWYRNEKEFYRFMPSKSNPIQTFLLHGIIVDISRSDEYSIVLLNITRNSSGIYKCEVSGEAPLFRTATMKKKMSVYTLPKKDPVIEGVQEQYDFGDELNVNCTSSKSYPPAELEWYINNVKAYPSMKKVYNVTRCPNFLYHAKLGLQFLLRRGHFQGGILRLKCTAKISSFYQKSVEKIVYQKNQLINGESMSAVYQYLPQSGSSCLTVNVKYLKATLCLLIVYTMIRKT